MTTETLSRPDPAGRTATGLIDCDIHPRLPQQADLLPYADAYWRDMFAYRAIDRQELMSHPDSIPAMTPPDRRPVIADAAALAAGHLEPAGIAAGILNVLSGAHAAYDPYLAAAMCSATNRWLAADWLDADPRLRASLLVPFQNPEAAVAEIEAHAGDRRFVQVLAILMGEKPLGRREFWPIYAAMEKHGFALAIHPGNSYRNAPSQCGFYSTRVEETVSQTQAFASQVASLLAEGVFSRHPGLKVVLAECGITWLPSLMWRMTKDWKGVRVEVPWIKEPPAEVVARHIRMTTQPFDAPDDAGEVARLLDHLGSDEMMLYASDFPHPHATGQTGLPGWLPAAMAEGVGRRNALETYARLEVKG